MVSYWKIKYERARTNLANEWERADTQEASWDGRFVWTRLMKPLQRLHQNGTRDLVTAATLRLRIYSWPAKYFVPTRSACGFRWIMHSLDILPAKIVQHSPRFNVFSLILSIESLESLFFYLFLSINSANK